jgi:hypothetical protein
MGRIKRKKVGKAAPRRPGKHPNRKKLKIQSTPTEEHPDPRPSSPRFRGLPLRFDVHLVSGLEELIRTAAGDVQDVKMSPAHHLAESANARQEIADRAVVFFHAVYYFAGRGQSWAIRILTEFALSATGAIEGVIESRSPAAEAMAPDTPFAAVVSVAKLNRHFPVLLRRHAKAYNKKKLKLPEIVQLGGGLGERINKHHPPNSAGPVNRVLDQYLDSIRNDPQLYQGLPALQRSKSVCRKWALRILEVFEQNNGLASEHSLFARLLKYGPKTPKGKRGVIRDAIQDALYRRQNEA